jgi:hypothetical protein
MPKPYVVPTYPVVKHKLTGTEEWVKQAGIASNGALWNNGTWTVRDIRGKPGQISNHARAVAMDLSYRFMQSSGKGGPDGRRRAMDFLRTALTNWERLGIQLVIDYFPEPHGRSWRCDRAGVGLIKPAAAEAWQKPTKHTFTGAPGGDWFHIEIELQMANDPDRVRKAFRDIFTTPSQGSASVTDDN